MPGRQRIVSVLCWWSVATSSGATWVRMHPISAQTATEIESREGCISTVFFFCLWIFVPALWRGSLFSLKVILRVKWQSFSMPLEGPSPTDKQSFTHLLFLAITFWGNPYLLRGSAWVMGGLRTGMLSALAAVPGEALCLVFQRGHHRYFGKSLFLNYRFPEPSEEMYLFCLVKFSAEKNSCLLSLLPPTEKNKDHSALPLASVKSLHRNCLMRSCFSCIDPVVLFVQENRKPISSNTSS